MGLFSAAQKSHWPEDAGALPGAGVQTSEPPSDVSPVRNSCFKDGETEVRTTYLCTLGADLSVQPGPRACWTFTQATEAGFFSTRVSH